MKLKFRPMKITLESDEITATISTENDDLDIYEVWMRLLRPMLIAFGYEKETVDSLTGESF